MAEIEESRASVQESLQQVIDSGDENSAMHHMATGASTLAARMHADGRIDGLLVLGGTMGTDLALDVASALPLGVPKVVLSTVSFSPLLPPENWAVRAAAHLPRSVPGDLHEPGCRFDHAGGAGSRRRRRRPRRRRVAPRRRARRWPPGARCRSSPSQVCDLQARATDERPSLPRD